MTAAPPPTLLSLGFKLTDDRQTIILVQLLARLGRPLEIRHSDYLNLAYLTPSPHYTRRNFWDLPKLRPYVT